MGRFTRFSTPSLFVLHTSGETHYWRPCLNATVIIGSFSFRKRNPRIRAYHAAAAFIASMVIWPTRALAAHAMEWIAYAPYAFASHMKHTGYYSLACKHAVRSTAPHPHASLPEHQLLTTICGINGASPFSKGNIVGKEALYCHHEIYWP